MNDKMQYILYCSSWFCSVFGFTILSILQIFSKKYKPWTFVLGHVGKMINREMLEKQNQLANKVDCLELKIKKETENKKQDKAMDARRRILRFADELRRKEKHSEEYFNNILEDVNFYKNFCNSHNDFKNEKANIAISLIEESYKKCLIENSFL